MRTFDGDGSHRPLGFCQTVFYQAAEQIFRLGRLHIHSGRRHFPTSKAYVVHGLLDGMGLTSLNRFSISSRYLSWRVLLRAGSPSEKALAQLMGLGWQNVGQHRDDSLCPQRQGGGNLVVVAGIDGQVVPAQKAILAI